MRKEVIFAVLSGSLLGLVIAFGVWRANQAFKSNIKTNTKQEQKENKKANPNNQFDLTIAAPENYSISTVSKVTFTGITRPDTFVVASSEDEDVIVKSDSKGSFSADVLLSGGINTVKITSLDPKNGTSEKTVSIIYSSEFKKFLTTQSDTTKEATGEANIREKVKEKLAEASKSPAAYVGTITDLTEKTMQVRNEDGEIMQVSLNGTEYVKITAESKKLEFKDLAIGDYVAALGFKENGDVLTGKRIIVTTKPEELKIVAVYGKVTNVDTKKKEIALVDNHEKEWVSQYGKKWDGPNLKEIETDQNIIVVGTQAESTISSTRTLYLVEEE